MLFSKHRNLRRGAALILVLWAVLLVSMAVFGLAQIVRFNVERLSAELRDGRLKRLSESGIAVALNPLVERGDPLLRHEFEPGEGFEVLLSSESARLNPNLLAAADPPDVLSRLLKSWGLKDGEISIAIDSLKDWIDPDALKRLNGAEREFYQDAAPSGETADPPNRLLQSVDELSSVRGWDRVAEANPDWADAFSIWSDGPLDLQYVGETLLKAVLDISDFQVRNFLRIRDGDDGEPGTEDDYQFKEMNEVRLALGLSEIQFESLQGLVALNGSVLRVVSSGFIGATQRTWVLIVRKNGDSSVWLDWGEK